MSLICSCCREQKFDFVEINFEIPKRESCVATGIVCVNCHHTQEIINIRSLTIPIKPSEEGSPDKMRKYIDTASGKKKNSDPRPQNASPISQDTLKALQYQNIDVKYGPDGKPSVGVLDPSKPVLQTYVPNDFKTRPNAQPNPEEDPEFSGPEADQSPV